MTNINLTSDVMMRNIVLSCFSLFDQLMMAPAQVFRVLVDMDEVIADYDGLFLERFKEVFPDEPFISLDQRRNFYLSDDYRELEKESPGIMDKLRIISEEEGLAESLPPLPGSLEAVKELAQMDNTEVFICTSPNTYGTHNDIKGKANWIDKHFGVEWLDRLIIAKDKSMVNGHVLIDDRPQIKGAVVQPSWKHLLFTSYHNRHIDLVDSTGVERLANWTDNSWKELLEKYRQLTTSE